MAPPDPGAVLHVVLAAAGPGALPTGVVHALAGALARLALRAGLRGGGRGRVDVGSVTLLRPGSTPVVEAAFAEGSDPFEQARACAALAGLGSDVRRPGGDGLLRAFNALLSDVLSGFALAAAGEGPAAGHGGGGGGGGRAFRLHRPALLYGAVGEAPGSPETLGVSKQLLNRLTAAHNYTFAFLRAAAQPEEGAGDAARDLRDCEGCTFRDVAVAGPHSADAVLLDELSSLLWGGGGGVGKDVTLKIDGGGGGGAPADLHCTYFDPSLGVGDSLALTTERCVCHSLPVFPGASAYCEPMCQITNLGCPATRDEGLLQVRGDVYRTTAPAPAAPGGVALSVGAAVPLEEVDDSKFVGRSIAVVPFDGQLFDYEAIERNAGAFSALCGALLGGMRGLVGRSDHDFCRGCRSALPVTYLLSPGLGPRPVLMLRQVMGTADFLPLPPELRRAWPEADAAAQAAAAQTVARLSKSLRPAAAADAIDDPFALDLAGLAARVGGKVPWVERKKDGKPTRAALMALDRNRRAGRPGHAQAKATGSKASGSKRKRAPPKKAAPVGQLPLLKPR